MKIGIIGSSGFLGKNLKNFLIKRKKVTLFLRLILIKKIG